jgi:hypothetical protein
MAIADSPLTITLEEVNKVTEEEDKKLSIAKLKLEYARRRGFVVSQFKTVAQVIADNMFPADKDLSGHKGLEFANLKLSTACPETMKRMVAIRRELF